MVERHLAKVVVESSSLFARSISRPSPAEGLFLLAEEGEPLWVKELKAAEFFALPPSLAAFAA